MGSYYNIRTLLINMKFILIALFLFASLLAAPQDEILVIEQLIETTKKNLDSQERLLKSIQEFNQAREAFLSDLDNGRLATRLVKMAMQLHNYLEKEHLTHLFSSDFLQELTFYNQVGKQQLARD